MLRQTKKRCSEKGTLLTVNGLVRAEIWHGGMFGVWKLISIVGTNSKEDIFYEDPSS